MNDKTITIISLISGIVLAGFISQLLPWSIIPKALFAGGICAADTALMYFLLKKRTGKKTDFCVRS